MKDAIRQIVDEIPSGMVFDSHFVIARLIRQHSDAYLSFASALQLADGGTIAMHGRIGQEIAKLEGTTIAKIQNRSWSENIHGNASDCTAWKKT
jgi:hypothetical protein